MTRTEWGVESPWGRHPAEGREAADRITSNMRSAGHEARVIWRAVSDWQEADDE